MEPWDFVGFLSFKFYFNFFFNKTFINNGFIFLGDSFPVFGYEISVSIKNIFFSFFWGFILLFLNSFIVNELLLTVRLFYFLGGLILRGICLCGNFEKKSFFICRFRRPIFGL